MCRRRYRSPYDLALIYFQVLCEMQTAMGDCGVTPPPNIGRDIMPDGIRLEPHYNLRDWIIFRDYINGLEYVHQVFSYLCKENGTNS